MKQGKYDLSWENFSGHLKSMLDEIYRTNHMTDVTLVCDDGQEIKAHSIVLSACSSVLRDTVRCLPKTGAKVHLKTIKYQEMKHIIEFMYLGRTTVDEDTFQHFINASKLLKISNLGSSAEDLVTEQHVTDKNSPTLAIEQLEHKNDSVNISKENCLDSFDSKKTSDKEYLQKLFCNHCDYYTLNENTLESHIRRKHTEYVCKICNEPHKKKIHLKVHMKERHVEYEYYCHHNNCKYQGLSKIDLKQHKESTHEGVRYPCTECNSQYSEKTDLKAHILAVHKGITYSCDNCDHQASSKKNLRIHRKSKHEGVKYDCPECNHQVASSSGLRNHMQTKHGGVKYDCPECHHQAASSSGLWHHMQSKHEGVKYICTKCDQLYSNRKSLARHMQSIHKGVRYNCTECDFQSTDKNQIKQHIQSVHKGESMQSM